MKLPPEPPDDVTPPESSIATHLDLGPLMSTAPTVDLGNQNTEIVGHGRITLHTLVRARAGAWDAAYDACARECERFYLSWRRGAITGASLTAVVVGIVTAGICLWQGRYRTAAGIAVVVGGFGGALWWWLRRPAPHKAKPRQATYTAKTPP